jgi:outer membrane protein with beta-barrel domain
MRTLKLVIPVVLAGFAALHPSPALGQTRSPLARADVTGVVAVLGVENDAVAPYVDDDWHSSFFGGLAAGWYWTDNLKTELDFGAGTESQVYRSTPITIGGRSTYVSTQSTISQRTLGVSQQYQFFRNDWFHPHVAGGVNVSWEDITDEISPVVIYDPAAPPRQVEPGRRAGPRTETTVRPFIGTGFKAYFNQRGFFRTDIRFAFRSGLDEVLVRAGFGIDF